MDNNWHTRLKEAREKAGLTLKKISETTELNISQQSLVKYEQGEVFPRIDMLDKMCRKYSVTIDYILYGTSEISKSNDVSGQLVSLFMLMYTKKIVFIKNNKSLIIKDWNLNRQILALNTYLETKEISTIDDLSNLINAIKKLENE